MPMFEVTYQIDFFTEAKPENRISTTTQKVEAESKERAIEFMTNLLEQMHGERAQILEIDAALSSNQGHHI